MRLVLVLTSFLVFACASINKNDGHAAVGALTKAPGRYLADSSKPVNCTIEKQVGKDMYRFELLGKPSEEIGLRIIKNGEEDAELKLETKKMLLGGYEFEGKEHAYMVGWRVATTLLFLNGDGFDFKITAKNNVWGHSIEAYTFCRR